MQSLDELGVVGGARHGGGARVRHVRQERAQGEHERALERLGGLQHGGAVGAPAQVGLVADEDDEVGAAGGGGRPQLGVGPGEVALAVVAHGDHRPGGGEVEEVLGVDGGHVLGVVAVGQPARRAGRRVARVVPALERGHEDRSAELWAMVPAKCAHGFHAIDPSGSWRAPASGVGTGPGRDSKASADGHRAGTWRSAGRNTRSVPSLACHDSPHSSVASVQLERRRTPGPNWNPNTSGASRPPCW